MNRLNWMDHNFDGQVLQPAADISAASNKITFTLRGDYFRHPILKKGHFTLNDAPSSLSIEDVTFISATTCLLTLSGEVSSYPELSVTVDKKIINTWDDVTSNKLATASSPEAYAHHLTEVFVSNGIIRLNCFEPKLLPQFADLYSVTGQLLRKYELQQQSENLLEAPGIPGIYILKLGGLQQTHSFKILIQ